LKRIRRKRVEEISQVCLDEEDVEHILLDCLENGNFINKFFNGKL
jgi:hypothetical protein